MIMLKSIAAAVATIAFFTVAIYTTFVLKLSPSPSSSSISSGRSLQDCPSQNPDPSEILGTDFKSSGFCYGLQVVFGVLFYFTVVTKYTWVEAPPELSIGHMKKNAVTETFDSCCQPVCWTSYC